MSSSESSKHKKRRRDHSVDRNSLSNKRWTPFPSGAPTSSVPIFYDRDPDAIMDVEQGAVADSSSHRFRRTELAISLTDLPIELIWSILQFLDSDTALQPTRSIYKHGIRDCGEIHRRDLHHVRSTCTFLKDVTLSPYLWAGHLLLRSGSISMPSLSSMSPYRHDQTSLRTVRTLTVVLEDSLSDLRQRGENLLNLIGASKIQTLILVRPSSASETFVRSPVVAELTPAEQLLRFLSEETALLRTLHRLTLINVVVRPTLLQTVHKVCGKLVKLDQYWTNVSLPSFESRKAKPTFGESQLLTVPNASSSTSRDAPPHATHSSGPATIFLSRESQLLLDFVPSSPMQFSRLHLTGPGATAVSLPWLTPSLREIHLDFSVLSDIPFWERLQMCLRALPTTCPQLVSFSLYLGKNNNKVLLDFGETLPKLFNLRLEALACDVPIPLEIVPLLSASLSRSPHLQILELRFSSSNTASTTPSVAITSSSNQSSASAWNPLFAPPVQPPFASFGAPTPSGVFGNNNSGFLPQSAPNFGSLASLFGGPRSNVGASSSTTRSQSATAAPSLLNALSQHCSALRRLRLTKDAGQSVTEPWTHLQFPCLSSLRYNLGAVPASAFINMDKLCPQLVHLDLAHAEMTEPGQSLSGLEQASGLQGLRLEGCNVDLKSLLPLFESRKASSSLSKLDLRVAHPHGLDELLLRRIGSSCGSSLVQLSFSIAQARSSSSASSISHQAFANLLHQCKRLKSIRTAENSSIPSATADLIRSSGVEFLRS